MGVVTGYNDKILSYNNIGGSRKNLPLMLSLTVLVKLFVTVNQHLLMYNH